MYRSKYNQKCFLHRAHTICSEKYIKEEIQFLVNMSVENRHKRTFLETLIKDYNTKNKNSDNRNDTNRKNPSDAIPLRLYGVVRAHKPEKNYPMRTMVQKNSGNRNDTNRKKISWIPNIGPKIKKEFKKVNKDITFTSDKSLKHPMSKQTKTTT